MNGITHPHRVALTWLPAQGFYVLATDGTSRAFTDINDAVSAICVVLDQRLNEMPMGSC